MTALARIGAPGVLLTKKQLAEHLGRSERWIELRLREGLPSEPPSKRYASRRFNLADVQAWLSDGQPTVAKPVPVRLAELEREVVSLRDRIRELEEGR